jgi:hypothetical protein
VNVIRYEETLKSSLNDKEYKYDRFVVQLQEV